MPYPPPPPAPGVGEFQGIGLLPAPAIPDVTGETGNFLETDGVIVQWEPVAGSALPDQSGHSGQFLTTDGATASWSVIGSTLPTQTGHGGDFLATDGTNASWATILSPFSVQLYGAVGNGIVDDQIGFAAALAAAITVNGFPYGNVVTAPSGDFYFASPLLIRGNATTLQGAGPFATRLQKLGSNPYQGPLLMVGTNTTWPAGTTAGYVNGGLALVFTDALALPGNQSILILSDSRAMLFQNSELNAAFPPNYNVTAFSFQVNVKVTTLPPDPWARNQWIASSYGNFMGSVSSCFQLKFNDTDITKRNKLVAQITTTSGVTVLTGTADVVVNTKTNIEVSYDGAHVGLWQEGVLVASAATTGALAQQPWETWTLGCPFNDIDEINPVSTAGSFLGSMDSVRISNVQRHTTGGGNFTPPTVKYTFDANTLFLMNLDQSVPSANGCVLAQGPKSNRAGPSDGVPVIHYARFFSQNPPGFTTVGVNVQGFGFECASGAPGLITLGQVKGLVSDIYMAAPLRWGIHCGSFANTFFNFYRNIIIDGGANAALALVNSSGVGANSYRDFNLTGGAMPISMGAGDYNNIAMQSGAGSRLGLRIKGTQTQFAIGHYETVVMDNENPVYPSWAANVLIENDSFAQINCTACSFLAPPTYTDSTPINIPVVTYKSANTGGNVVFDTCTFGGGGTAGVFGSLNHVTPSVMSPFILRDCDTLLAPGPLSDFDMTRQSVFGSESSVVGLSSSQVSAQNLNGTFDVRHGFSTATVRFIKPELGTNYIITFQAISAIGGTPAAGSTNVLSYDRSTDGFVATLGADPGGSVVLTFGWTLQQGASPPLLWVPDPTVPGSYTNPLDGATGGFAVGITAVPASGNVFAYNNIAQQAFVGTGGYLGANTWAMTALTGTTFITSEGVPFAYSLNSYVSNGKLAGLLNPGPHNVAFNSQSTTLQPFIDGVGAPVHFGPDNSGTQQTPIRTGELSGATMSLTTATLRNLKVDTNINKVITIEPDAGPGTMPSSGFIGDTFVVGQIDTSGLGGFASQIANARYGTAYYYIGAGEFSGQEYSGINTYYWQQWGATAGLTNLCLFGGYLDILSGRTAAAVFADIQVIMNGSTATATFVPPTANQFAIAEYVPPFRGVPGPHVGSATCVIGGHTKVCTFNTDDATTITDLANACNADSNINVLCTSALDTSQPPNDFMLCTSVIPGLAGNSITTGTDGAHGAFWFPGFNFIGGTNATITIAGVVFNVLFDTDADTTVNNLIAEIVANVTVNALVTCTLVSHRMLITANTAGNAGNSITISTNGAFGATFTVNTQTTLTGGLNGAVGTIPNIILCNVPPIGNNPADSGPKETELTSLNASINGYSGAGVTIADVNTTLWDPSNHQKFRPAYLDIGGIGINTAGHSALFTLLAPLLPGVGTAPSALSYATNPASYVSTVLITPNLPTVTGTVIRWTVSPPLPTGLAISSTTGHVTGTPTTPTAAANYRVCATNTAGTIFVDLNITIT